MDSNGVLANDLDLDVASIRGGIFYVANTSANHVPTARISDTVHPFSAEQTSAVACAGNLVSDELIVFQIAELVVSSVIRTCRTSTWTVRRKRRRTWT